MTPPLHLGRRPRFTAISLMTLTALLLSLAWWAARPATADTGTVYQAENAALSGGAAVATDHTGYTGTGFVGGYTDGNKGKAATTFTVNAASAGSYTSALRYANGTSSTMTLSISVNGTRVTQVSLPATSDWNTWTTATTPITLAAGSDTVAYTFTSSDSGNVNLDAITLTPAAATPAGQYEAEAAALSGGAAVAADHTGYTGTGFVGGYTDGNKGNAATTFTVTAAAAGATPVTLRYANGTGSAKTLAVYVNGGKVLDTSLAATADWNTWGTKAETLQLNGGPNTIAYKFDSSDSGNVNLDNITVGTATGSTTGGSTTGGSSTGGSSGGTSPTGGAQVYPAATAFFTGGPSVATSISGYTGTGYLTGFTAQGAETVIDTAVPSTGSYAVAVTYANSTGSTQTLSLYVNGVRNGQISLPAKSGWQSVTQTLALRGGLDLIGLQHDSGDTGDVAVNSVSVTGGSPLAAQGATLPYTEYRAADSSQATTTGSVLKASTSWPSTAAESTGHSSVQLTSTGQYVQIKLAQAADSVVVRYSVPDSSGDNSSYPLSLYAGGSKVTDLQLTNKYSWTYGDGYNDLDNPGNGGDSTGHHRFDEVRYLNSTTWPAGTVLKLQKDAADTASSYTIDVIDTELVDAAYAMPAGYVSAATYGVKPDGSDVTSALNSALSSAASAGKGLWLPAGTYTISGRVNLGGVSLRGAGEWYTTLQSTAENGSGGLFTTGGKNQIADLSIFGDQTSRNGNQGAAAIEGTFTSGSLIFDVWMEHTKVGLWANPGTGLLVSDVRARDQFADGLHVHGGSSGTRLEQSSVRNTGDDNIALDTEGGNVTNSTVVDNTAQLPMLANGIGVYGGGNNLVEANAVSDSVLNGSGITVSSWFGQNFSGPTTVQDNLLVRTGSYDTSWTSDIGALWIYAADQGDITQPIYVKGNTIKDATYQAVLLSYNHKLADLELSGDTITDPGTYAFDIYDVTGTMTVSGTTVTGAGTGGLYNDGSPNFTVTRGSGNSGF
jgi:hypothetical protein